MTAFVTSFLVIALAEMGDKTQLVALAFATRFTVRVTLASQQHAFVPVWLGSTAGMTVADGLAIAVGIVAGRRLPERAIKLVAGAIFIGFGAWAIISALR